MLRTVADGGRTNGTRRTPAVVRSLVRAGLVAGFAGLAWLLADATATAAPSPSVFEPAPTDPAAGSAAAVLGTGAFRTEAMEDSTLTRDSPTFGRDTPLASWPTSPWRDDATEPDDAPLSAQGRPDTQGSAWSGPGTSGADTGGSGWGGDWAQVWTGVATAGWGTGWPTAGGFPHGAGNGAGNGEAGDGDAAGSIATVAAPAPQPDTTTDGPVEVTTAREVDTVTTTPPRRAATATRPHTTGGPPAPMTDSDPSAGTETPPPGPTQAPVPTPMGSTGNGSATGAGPQHPVGTVAGGPARPATAPVRAWIAGPDQRAPVRRPGRATTSPD